LIGLFNPPNEWQSWLIGKWASSCDTNEGSG
jgi:hypothetical protein